MGDIIRDSMHVTFPRSRAPPGLRTLRAPHQAPGPTRTHHTPLATSPSHNSVTAQAYPLPLHCYRHPATAPPLPSAGEHGVDAGLGPGELEEDAVALNALVGR